MLYRHSGTSLPSACVSALVYSLQQQGRVCFWDFRGLCKLLHHFVLESADMHKMSFVSIEHVCNQDIRRLVNSIHMTLHS